MLIYFRIQKENKRKEKQRKGNKGIHKSNQNKAHKLILELDLKLCLYLIQNSLAFS